MGRAPSVEKVFFPLDEELELLPSKLAPRQYEHLVHLSCFMPFDKAAQMMQEIASVQTNEETVRRLTEQVGSWMETAQTAEVEADGESEPEEQPLERCVISPDGAMISLIHKQWVETRTVAIGEPQERLNAQGEREIHVGNLSYFSRLTDALTFTRLASVEIRRRKVPEAKEVCAVMDGADWCQLFAQMHRPDAVRILDFPHAGEHIHSLLEALERAKIQFPAQMLDRCLHILKHRGPRPLLRMADRLGNDLTQQKEVNTQLDYLRKREGQMQYPEFRQKGWPIGSGMVESAQKNVVEARLKGAGMHWQRKNVNSMLTLRNAVCNDRWKEMWQKAVLQYRKQQALQRSARIEQRTQARRTCGDASSEQAPSQSPAVPSPLSPPPACQALRSAEAPAVTPAPCTPVTTRPSLSRARSRRKRHTARNRMKYSPQPSGEVQAEVCSCGVPLVRLKGHRTRQYCSDRCRQRAHRERQRHIKLLPPATLMIALPGYARHQRRRRTSCESRQVNEQPGGVKGEICPCGAHLVRVKGHRTREYCSDRCRQRAHRQRQAKMS